jgi:hypothetical protein
LAIWQFDNLAIGQLKTMIVVILDVFIEKGVLFFEKKMSWLE